jgi:hypothetical protein
MMSSSDSGHDMCPPYEIVGFGEIFCDRDGEGGGDGGGV